MGFRVIGAGMPRTGTLSLRTALIRLLDGPCYQMEEVFDHLEHVAAWPPDRLLEWRASDGWEPICRALGSPVPDEPFPHLNTREEYAGTTSRSARVRTRVGMIGPPPGIPNGGTASIPLASKEP